MNLQLKPILSKAIEHLDVTLAILGCILSIPLTLYLQAAIGRPLYTTVGVISFLSFLTYLGIRRKSLLSSTRQLEVKSHTYLLLNILFFSLLCYSILALHLRAELYTRPLGYFISTSAMVAILAVEILFLPPRKSHTYFALLKIIVIALSLGWSQLLIFPTVVGVDPWVHQMFTLSMLDAGHIVYSYNNMPCFHLIVGATSLVTGLGYKMAAMFSVSLLQVICDTLFIFLLGKFIHSTKAGLLAALLLGVACWHIGLGFWTIPNTLAAILIPIVIYLLFKLRQDRPITSLCLSALFMSILLSTHALTPVCLSMLLFLFWLGFEIYRRMGYQGATSAKAFLIAFILFTVATLSYWTFVSGHINTLISLVQAEFSGDFFAQLPPQVVPPLGVTPPPEALPPLNVAVAQYRDSVPFTEQLFNQFGFFLFFAFSFIGSLAMLSKRMRNSHGFALVVAGLGILAINFFSIISYHAILSGRWHYFCQILLAIPVGIAFLWLGGLPRSKVLKASLLGIMTFLLSFLMIMSTVANLDNRTFSPNTITRYAFTQSEVQAMDTVSGVYRGEIGVDYYCRLLQFLPSLGNNVKVVTDQIYRRDFSDCQDTFIFIREEVIQHHFQASGAGLYRLNYDPRQTLAEQGFSKVYDCGSASGFAK